MAYYPTNDELKDIIKKRAVLAGHEKWSPDRAMLSVANAVRALCVGEDAPLPPKYHVTIWTDTGPHETVMTRDVEFRDGVAVIFQPNGARMMIPTSRIERIQISKVPA